MESVTMPKNPFIGPKHPDSSALEVGSETMKEVRAQIRREYGPRRDQQRLLDLFGKLDWDDEYDYKRERTRQRFPS